MKNLMVKTIEEAKRANANILLIEKLQRCIRNLKNSQEDLDYWQSINDNELIEFEKNEISRIKNDIKELRSILSESDIEFFNKYNVIYIDGEGGRDKICVELK